MRALISVIDFTWSCDIQCKYLHLIVLSSLTVVIIALGSGSWVVYQRSQGVRMNCSVVALLYFKCEATSVVGQRMRGCQTRLNLFHIRMYVCVSWYICKSEFIFGMFLHPNLTQLWDTTYKIYHLHSLHYYCYYSPLFAPFIHIFTHTFILLTRTFILLTLILILLPHTSILFT